MNSQCVRLITLALALSLGACSYFEDKEADSKLSAAELSSSSGSSSSDAGRVEIEYSDTLQLKDSVNYSMGTGNFFVGHLPKGTVIHLGLLNKRLATGAQFRILSESGDVQRPTNSLANGEYTDYSVASDTTYFTNHFIVLDTGYYYLEVEGKLKTGSTDTTLPDFKASLAIDSAYYQFTGVEDSTELPVNLAFHGCFPIHDIEDSTQFYFASNAGKNLTLVSNGQSLKDVILLDQTGSVLDSADTKIRVQMLPQDTAHWSVRIRTSLASYYAGNYAFFDLNLTSIQLDKGEYFAKPDTMPRAGDTLIIARQGSESAGWDVRHDHYIWLGNLTAGDSVILWHGMSGISKIQKLLRILDSKGKPVDTINPIISTNWNKAQGSSFTPQTTGGYYLHYSGIGSDNTYWTDENYTMNLKAMIQKPGSLTAFDYNPTEFGYLSSFKVGDTLSLKELLTSKTISPSSASKNYLPILMRAERSILVDSVDIEVGNMASGDEIRSDWLVGAEPGIAHIILQSTADPTRTDTCTVKVVAP